MKITEILVERFGVWRDLSLPLNPGGLNVIYGPNEAGKSTLLRFIRGMLYGFRPPALGVHGRRRTSEACSGALRIEHDGRTGEVRRRYQPQAHGPQGDERGMVDLIGFDGHAPGGAPLDELLAGVDEGVYERVFAVGLSELQELATLEHAEVARQVYGLSLGPDGQRLLDVMASAADERQRLIGADGLKGEFGDLIRREDELKRQIADLDGQIDRHADLCRDRDDLDDEIASLKSRRADLQRNLRGCLFLERVWGPWSQTREYRAELDRIPPVAGFPEHGLERLDRLDEELTSATRCRDALHSEAAQLRKESESLEPDAELQKHAGTMQAFVDQRGWIQELVDACAAAETRHQTEQTALDERVAAIGPDWSAKRLEAVDCGPAAHHRLVTMAREYQSQSARQGKFRRYLKRMSKACHQRGVEVQDRVRELGGRSLDEAIADTRTYLTRLEELTQLRLRESELEQRRGTVSLELKARAEREPLPKWVFGLLIFFAVGGIAGAIFGAMTGLTGNLLAGAMWASLGVTCALLSWGLKSHFERDDRDVVERLQSDSETLDVELRQTREEIGRIDGHGSAPQAASESASAAEQIRAATQRLSELERLASVDRRTQAMRRRLSELRSRFQRVQRDLSTVRHNWCELLRQLGIGETVRVDEAFETWQRIVEAGQQQRECRQADDELAGHRKALAGFERRLADLRRRMPARESENSGALDVLSEWETILAELQQSQSKQRQLRRDEKSRRREAAEYQTRIDELKTQRAALLVQGGAATREEFEQRAEWTIRRREFDELLELARGELAAAAAAEPELAIVEEDLLAYDAAANGEQIKQTNAALESLERELQEAFELLGSIKQEIRTLESDRRAADLRFDLESVRGEMRQSAEHWFGLQLASQTADALRAEFERTCQPPTLAATSQSLRQLTGGRYGNVWTPLGRRQLCIEDDRRTSLSVEQLSNGTREQLFLAIRLAMMHQARQQGIELPVVLDDVVVNFDQHRTEAAVDTLIDFAREGQQILLFTCHLHLAKLFETRGILPIWLPGHQTAAEERRAG